MTQSFNIAFVVWRESVEALLVIGILNAWLTHQPQPLRVRGRVWLWAGVAAGVFGAVLLACLFLRAQDVLSDDLQEYFQIAIVFFAACLIVQMVWWMRAHGRRLKGDLHAALDQAANQAHFFNVFLLAALAVLREGAEAVVFLFGAMTSASVSPWMAALAAGLGFAAAYAAYALLQAGNKFLSWSVFFRITEAMLLFLGAALFMTGVDRLMSLGLAPPLSGPLWDLSSLLPDSGPWGGLLASLTGYRAKPVLLELLAYLSYWVVALWLFHHSPNPRPLRAQAARRT